MATYPSLAGKVIAISGAASGMGLALAKHLYPMGCKLSLTDLNEQGLDAAVVEIASTSPPHPMSMESLPSLTYSPHSGIHSSPPPTEPQNIFSIAANVSESVEVDAWISATISRFGRLDNAANFAGIIGPFKKVSEFNDEEWQKVQDVNLRGTFYALRAQLRVLEGAGHGGSIVNTASIAGFRGGYAGAAYTMSKHGVIGLTRAASKDVGHLGIRVNVIAP
jgi:NAD(P)-dependent dehydrogenase (short-subunit alcohol dehydrogenase family)